MWTSKNCARYDRSKLRYPSDVLPSLVVPHAGPCAAVHPERRTATRRRFAGAAALHPSGNDAHFRATSNLAQWMRALNVGNP